MPHRALKHLRGQRATLRRDIDKLEDDMEATQDKEEYERLSAQRRAKRDELRDVQETMDEMSTEDAPGDKDDKGNDKDGKGKGKDDKGKDDKGKDDKAKDDKGKDEPPQRQHWGDRRIFGRGSGEAE